MARDLNFRVGFHDGIGGNKEGLVTWADGTDGFLPSLDQAGIGFFLKSVDDYGLIEKSVEEYGPKHTLVFRLAESKDGHNFDVPDYSLNPAAAAQKHWAITYDYLPDKFKNRVHKGRVWIEVVNEVDKNRSEWMAEFSVAIAKLAMAEGVKTAHFGWSSGEPEPEHWRKPEMIKFLRFAAANREMVAVAVHEYSFSDDLFNAYPYLLGRYRDINAACEEAGINPLPYTLVTEFGWGAFGVPEAGPVTVEQLREAADMYYANENVLGAAIWYLGMGWNNISAGAQKYIDPLIRMAFEFDYWRDMQEVIPCDFDDAFTKFHILRPRSLDAAQKAYIDTLMTDGIPASDLGIPNQMRVAIGYEGWSHVDAILAIKRAVEADFTDSRLVVVDGHLIGTGLDADWIAANCPVVAPYTVFLASADQGLTFKYDSWPLLSLNRRITQYFGANPSNYAPYGLPGHEGVDFGEPQGTPVIAPAPGYITEIHHDDGTHNYGAFIRIMHVNGYETTFAHLHRINLEMSVGRLVETGEIVGYVGSTGHSFGAHLHLTLKRHGFPYTDEFSSPDPWPYDIQDPTPFLKALCPSCFEPVVEPPLPPAGARALLGLHATADASLAVGEIEMMKTAGIEMLKVSSNLRHDHASALAAAFPAIPLIIRAFVDFGGRVVTPAEFFDWTYPDVREIIARFGPDTREIWVELHNEPNLFAEGLGNSWSGGAGFELWLEGVIALYRDALGGVKLLYPGLSPGGEVPGVRADSLAFLTDSMNAVRLCDGVAVHNYWSSVFGMSTALQQLAQHLGIIGDRPVFVTEASNNDGSVSVEAKAVQYVEYPTMVAALGDVRGVTYFVSSATNPAWLPSGSGEVWLGTMIPAIVGSR